MRPSIKTGSWKPGTDYEDYSTVSKTYGHTRVPIGLEIILGCLAVSSTRPLHEQVVLDAGCGTGTYVEALHLKVSVCYGIDINAEMLRQALRKFANVSNVRIDHGSLLDLPYEENLFDGITCNQVIHHLDDFNERDAYPNVAKVFAEFYRVLRPNGVVILNTCSREQLREGYWWADLIPQAVGQMSSRTPSIEHTEQMLEAAGFHVAGISVPLHEVLQGPSYFDPQGPLHKWFRDGDSTWSLLSQQELNHALELIKKMNDDGSIGDYLSRHDHRRRRVGQTTFIYARKGTVLKGSEER